MSVLNLATTQVNIYSVTDTQNAYGGYKSTYKIVYANVPARVNYNTGRETDVAGKIQNIPIYRIYLPKQLTINATYVIVDRIRSLYYDILYVNKMDRKSHLQVDCKLSSSLLMNQGWTWGYNGSAIDLMEESWKTWTDDGSYVEALNTGDYGDLQVVGLDKFVSPVKDSGDSASKTIALSYDDYDAGSSNGNKYIWYRGSYTSFKQDNILIPWVLYTVPVVTTLRYFQVRVGIY